MSVHQKNKNKNVYYPSLIIHPLIGIEDEHRLTKVSPPAGLVFSIDQMALEPRIEWRFVLSFSSTEWFGTAFREFVSIFCCTGRNSELCSLPRNSSERNSENFRLFWFHGTEFRVVFSSTERFGTELWELASICVSRNGIPCCFLFRGRVRNGIPRFSVPRNNRNSVRNNHLFRLFRLPRNYFFVGNSQPYCQVGTFF